MTPFCQPINKPSILCQGPYLIIYGRVYDCALGEYGYDGSTTNHIRFSHFNPVRRYDPQV